MKTILLYIFFSFLASISFGQLFDISPNSQIEIAISKGEEQTREFYIDNVSNDEIWLGWEIISNTIPTSWGYSLCDNRICYNTVPSSAFMEPISPESFGFMKLAVWNTSEGTGDIQIRIFDEAYTQIDTIRFIINHAKPIEIISVNDTRVFPNPVGTERVIHFENSTNQIKKVLIYNAFGQHILTHKTSLVKINSILLPNFNSGIYLFQFIDEKDEILFTRKIVLK